jgi:hypothetical protein
MLQVALRRVLVCVLVVLVVLVVLPPLMLGPHRYHHLLLLLPDHLSAAPPFRHSLHRLRRPQMRGESPARHRAARSP